MKVRINLAVMAALALLAACGWDEGGELTGEENQQLDSAENMLNDSLIDVSADSLVANEAELDAIAAAENRVANASEPVQ